MKDQQLEKVVKEFQEYVDGFTKAMEEIHKKDQETLRQLRQTRQELEALLDDTQKQKDSK